MATYAELRALFGSDDLRNRVEVAVVVKATAILKSTNPAPPTAGQRAYAFGILNSPNEAARAVWMYVLADSASATVLQITSATDVAIQAKVDAAMDVLKGA